MPNDISLTPAGVYAMVQGEKRRIAKRIQVIGRGRRDSDDNMFARIRFRTIDGQTRTEFVKMSQFQPERRSELISRLADLGFRWPQDKTQKRDIVSLLEDTNPHNAFRLVGAPGWQADVVVMPGRVFAPPGRTEKIYLDPEALGTVAPFCLGEGSLKSWVRRVARPSRRSSALQFSIAAALAATFLRPLKLDSFGINWFGPSSTGKTLCLIVAASVVGFVPDGQLPGWADSEAGLEDRFWGHRDFLVPLDEAADGEHKQDVAKRAQMLAFALGRNHPRKLAKAYEQAKGLQGREYRVLLLSSSERALKEIANEKGSKGKRGAGEEVRFNDIPASSSKSSGIFDRKLRPQEGRTLRETTQRWAVKLKANAIRYQGHAIRAMLKAYMKDPEGLAKLKSYMSEFENRFAISDAVGGHLRIRTNFAAIYAVARLATDYGILPWSKKHIYRMCEKCLSGALGSLVAIEKASQPARTTQDAPRLLNVLKKCLATARLVRIKPKGRLSEKQLAKRGAADGFILGHEAFIRSKCVEQWLPEREDRQALRALNLVRTERSDTPTVSKKIAGLPGRSRYYVFAWPLMT